MNLLAKVDVLIVTYNHKNYISQNLESVLAQQTTFEFNIIVGDDCSVDGTIEILKEYEKKFPNKIFVTYQPVNLGPYHRERNIVTMLNNSKAKYIAVCDGDDYWIDPFKLQKQYDFLEAHSDFSMCFHNSLIRHEYTKTVNKEEALFNGVLPKDTFEFKDVVDGWIAHTSSLFFVNRDLIPLPEWFWSCFTGDLVIILLLAGKGKLKYLDFTGSVYRLNDGGVSRKYQGRFLIEGKIEVYNRLNKHFDYSLSNAINPVLAKYYYQLIPINFYALEIKKGLIHLFKAIKLKPLGLFTDLPVIDSFKIFIKKVGTKLFNTKK